MTLLEALVAVGVASILLGIAMWSRGPTSRSLGIAFIVVGVSCAGVAIAGRRFGLW